MPQVLLYKWTLVERERRDEMEPNERKEMQSSKTHLVPDSCKIETESNAESKSRHRERAQKPKGPVKKKIVKETFNV